MKIFETLQPEVRRVLARRELARRGPDLTPDESLLTTKERSDLGGIRAHMRCGDREDVAALEHRAQAILNLSGLRKIGIFLPDNGR
jgi:hypothetical protein